MVRLESDAEVEVKLVNYGLGGWVGGGFPCDCGKDVE